MRWGVGGHCWLAQQLAHRRAAGRISAGQACRRSMRSLLTVPALLTGARRLSPAIVPPGFMQQARRGWSLTSAAPARRRHPAGRTCSGCWSASCRACTSAWAGPSRCMCWALPTRPVCPRCPPSEGELPRGRPGRLPAHPAKPGGWQAARRCMRASGPPLLCTCAPLGSAGLPARVQPPRLLTRPPPPFLPHKPPSLHQPLHSCRAAAGDIRVRHI